MAKKKDITIEEGLDRLDEILEEMEEKDCELSKSFALYSEGINILKEVGVKIDAVEKQVMMLSENGELIPFDVNALTGEDED